MEVRTIEAVVHGRYLYEARSPQRLLLGFHGYAETAEQHLEQLREIPGIDDWSVAAVQALHPFYTREKVGASWMTSLDREMAIAENLRYVRSVVDALPKAPHLVFAGFSQGVAMAFRAAAHIGCSGLIVLGGDVPPEIGVDRKLPPVLLGRGNADDWYTAEKLEKDLKFLNRVTSVEACLFNGGHEWTEAFRNAAGEFLSRLSR